MVWVWGENTKGDLGVGDYSARVHPYPLVNLKGKPVDMLSVGSNFSLALGKPQGSSLLTAADPRKRSVVDAS